MITDPCLTWQPIPNNLTTLLQYIKNLHKKPKRIVLSADQWINVRHEMNNYGPMTIADIEIRHTGVTTKPYIKVVY